MSLNSLGGGIPIVKFIVKWMFKNSLGTKTNVKTNSFDIIIMMWDWFIHIITYMFNINSITEPSKLQKMAPCFANSSKTCLQSHKVGLKLYSLMYIIT